MRWSDETFTALFNALYPDLCRYLERLMGANGTAQDAAQEAFLRLHRLGPGKIAPSEERFWLYHVATRIALNELRRIRLRRRLGPFLAPFLRSAARETLSTEERVEHSDRDRRLRAALDRLPARQRAILILREFDELSYVEIAALVDSSLSKIKTDLFRARRALRAELLGSSSGAAQSSTRAHS